jgi:hypothetical protein
VIRCRDSSSRAAIRLGSAVGRAAARDRLSRHFVAAIAAAPLLSGCLSFSWVRDRRHEPPPTGAVQLLEPGRSTLAQALAALGDPLFVWEYKGDGAAHAWGWSDEAAMGFSVSVPLQEQFSPSFSYESGSSDLRGVVLLFGDDLVLEQMREGRLRDLESALGRRRPAPVP